LGWGSLNKKNSSIWVYISKYKSGDFWEKDAVKPGINGEFKYGESLHTLPFTLTHTSLGTPLKAAFNNNIGSFSL